MKDWEAAEQMSIAAWEGFPNVCGNEHPYTKTAFENLQYLVQCRSGAEGM
jgi:hypothetical protein